MALTELLNTEVVQWIDINDPTEEDLRNISDRYQLNWYQVQHSLHPDHLPSYEQIGDAFFIMTRYFSAQPGQHLHTMEELTNKVAIFYGKHFIVTIHKAEVGFIVNEIAANHLQDKSAGTASNILALLLLHTLRTYESAARKLSDNIDDYESTILLKTLKAPMLKGLYYLKRKAGIAKRLLILTGEILNFINTLEGEENTKRDIDDLRLRLTTWVDQIIEDVNNLLNTYLSLSAHKTNDVMKILTIFSVFFMPLTFIVGIYGMNFKFMPELESRWGYPLVLLLMAVLTGFIFFYFKRKRWL